MSEQKVGFRPNGIPSFALSSDGLYSLQRASTTYTGPAVQIRRSYDDALMDIGFDSTGLLDFAAIYSFVGTASGYLTTFYDQMNIPDNSLTQPITSAQPMVVSNSVALSFQMPGEDTSGATASGATSSQPAEFWRKKGKIIKNLSKPITMNITEPSNAFVIYDQQEYFQDFNSTGNIWY